MGKNRFKFRAWDKIGKVMYEGIPGNGAGKNGHDTIDIILKFPQIYNLMQSADVYADNVLVYEGDYLTDGSTIWEVVYCETMSGFSAKAVGGDIGDGCRWFSLYHLCNRHNKGRKVCVVGNVFEYQGILQELLKKYPYETEFMGRSSL